MNFIIQKFPQKIYKLSKTNTFFSHFEGTRGEKKQIFRTLLYNVSKNEDPKILLKICQSHSLTILFQMLSKFGYKIKQDQGYIDRTSTVVWTVLLKPKSTRSTEIKVHIFWEGHKSLRNLHCRFDLHYIGQIYGGDFVKFCGLLRIYEL